MGCAAVMILAASCAGRSKDSTAQKTVPEFVLTYAENQAEDYPTTQGAYKFAELVHEQTGGRVEIQVNAGGVLGDEKTVIEQLQFGGVDILDRIGWCCGSRDSTRILYFPFLRH